MGTVGATIESMCSEIDNQSRTIKKQVDNVNQLWNGEAQKSFNEAQNEVCQKVKHTMRKIQSMQSLLRSLENSMAAADRDIAAKKAAAVLARNAHLR